MVSTIIGLGYADISRGFFVECDADMIRRLERSCLGNSPKGQALVELKLSGKRAGEQASQKHSIESSDL